MFDVIANNLFAIPHWKIKTKDFQNKKILLNKLFEPHKEIQNDITIGNFNTNRYKTTAIVNSFTTILRDELQAISQTLKNDISVKEVWSVTYEKDGYHPIHNHGSSGLSAILYLDLPEDAPKTSFLQPWNNLITDNSIYATPDAIEGDLCFMPSMVYHFTQPNKSEKLKRTISWDMEIHSDKKIF